jgi:hypothetical protein
VRPRRAARSAGAIVEAVRGVRDSACLCRGQRLVACRLDVLLAMLRLSCYPTPLIRALCLALPHALLLARRSQIGRRRYGEVAVDEGRYDLD